ncbi:MAG: hypothetical protein ACE5E9_02250 [Nitrospinaceae bacterium]
MTLETLITLSVLAFTAGLALTLAILTFRGFGLIRIGWLNFSRMKELDRQRRECSDPEKRQALDAVITHCQALRKRWILRESDIRVGANTQRLIDEIASVYHPLSSYPLAEARLGRLLDAFEALKGKIQVWSRLPGVDRWTRFRVRHVLMLARAWKKKEEWRQSSLGRAIAKYRLVSFFRWVYFLFRFMDLTFWTLKMLRYILQDVIFKIFLLRWYLTVGELALQVYSGREAEPVLPAEDILQDLGSIEEKEETPDLPPGIRKIAESSRKNIWLNFGSLDQEQVRDIYFQLVEDIARYYHPRAAQPVYEVKLYGLLTAVSRLAGQAAAIRGKPVLNKLLDLRISHLLLVKDTADYLRDSEFIAWFRKYHLHRVLKFSRLIFQAVRRKHPGILFQDFAFTLVKEAGKRWLYIYIHDKIAEEANRLYQSSGP